MGFWKRAKNDHPDSWMFGPKWDVREVMERRPPLLRLAVIVAVAVIVPAVSAFALVGTGDAVPDVGVPDGTDLTRSGNVRVTEDGAVVDALDVRGYIYVLADDVTITRTRVRTGGDHAVKIAAGHTGTVVEDSTLACASRPRGRAGIAFGDYTATNVEVAARCRQGFAYNGNTTITDSYWGGEPFPDVTPTGGPTTTAPATTAPPTSTTVAPTTTTEPPPTTTEPPPTAVPPPSGGATIASSCRNAAEFNGTSARGEWPSDTTTGPEVAGVNEDALASSGHRGLWTITQDGTVIDGKFHNGTIEVQADNVTIRNSVICGVGPHIILNRGQNLVVENSIVRGQVGGAQNDTTGSPCEEALAFGNFTVRRTEITNCTDGMKVSGSVEVTGSWFHDNYDNRFGGGTGTHNDTVQMADSTMPRFVFEGNSAYQDPCTSNRHFQIAPVAGPKTIGTLSIENNFFYGINGFMFDRGITVASGVIASNTFAGSASQGPFHGILYAGTSMDEVTRSANVYESGEPANANPSPASYQCVGG
jgi:hypothetical protein